MKIVNIIKSNGNFNSLPFRIEIASRNHISCLDIDVNGGYININDAYFLSEKESVGEKQDVKRALQWLVNELYNISNKESILWFNAVEDVNYVCNLCKLNSVDFDLTRLSGKILDPKDHITKISGITPSKPIYIPIILNRVLSYGRYEEAKDITSSLESLLFYINTTLENNQHAYGSPEMLTFDVSDNFIRKQDGVYVMTVGKYKDIPITKITDMGYWKWVKSVANKDTWNVISDVMKKNYNL